MIKRIITAIVALAVFIPTLIFSDTWAFPLIMATAAVVGCYELISCVGQKKNILILIPILAYAAAFPILMRYMNYLWLSPDQMLPEFMKLAIGITMVLMLYVLSVSVFMNSRISITDTGIILAGCIYIVAAFTSIVYIRDKIEFGQYIFFMVFICAWVTDTFAYFVGKLIGKHKLIPSVSPKKTVEGAIGGVIGCVISTVLFGVILENFILDGEKANYLVLAVSGIFISVVSQTGDLIMSLIKRHYNIKDYGKILPGHGGVLDRFDSVIAVSLMIAFICTYFNLFN